MQRQLMQVLPSVTPDVALDGGEAGTRRSWDSIVLRMATLSGLVVEQSGFGKVSPRDQSWANIIGFRYHWIPHHPCLLAPKRVHEELITQQFRSGWYFSVFSVKLDWAWEIHQNTLGFAFSLCPITSFWRHISMFWLPPSHRMFLSFTYMN